MSRPYQPLFVRNNPQALRIDALLAAEIGLNESIILLQLEYLISISYHEREGRYWTYQSTRDLEEKFFPWWGIATINRAIKSLEEKELIIIGDFNEYAYDRTRWFSLNYEGLRKLKSIMVGEGHDTRPNENGTPRNENGTTIPKITPETTQDIRSAQKQNVRVSPPGNGQAKAISLLDTEFTKATALHRPPPSYKGSRDWKAERRAWDIPWKHLLFAVDNDVKEALACVPRAVNKLRDARLTIANPRSIEKTAIAIAGERAQVPKGRSVSPLDPDRIAAGL